ncbi:flagellar type III secretion system pore protein FliP [Gemmatimonas aurantiaca]|nr:flagellar type III secretion system pore protein FliP [Gemmatimonas aurantiaca]
MNKRIIWLSALAVGFLLALGADSIAQDIPKISLEIGETKDGVELSTTLKIVLMMTALTLAPSILIMTTSFIRITIVLGFLRQAMGSHQAPPNQLLVGLALIITFFIMTPIATKSYEEGVKPYMAEEISKEEAYEKIISPLREFMLKQTREKDLSLFVNLARIEIPDGPEDLPLHVLIPGFVISELRIAFQIAFLIFIPFLAIDMVVASVLMSMGMMMLPPVMISLPFKILLFVLVDGWYLLIKSLVESFHMY